MDAIFKALSDPTRRALLDRLRDKGGQTLTELEAGLAMTRFGVMKHLKVLEDARLVVTRKSGRFKYHYLNALPIQEVADRWMAPYAKPLARFALYETGVEIYLAPTADDSEDWHDSIRHIARESRGFVISPSVFQRASSYPADVPIAEGPELLGRGGSAIVGPDGHYLAGPLWDEEGILYAELDPQRLYEARQRFDPAGHYHRPDVFRLRVRR